MTDPSPSPPGRERDGLYLLGTAAVLVVCVTAAIWAGDRDVLLLVTGAAIGWVSAIIQYRFGSSVGSKRKTELLLHHPDPEGPQP